MSPGVTVVPERAHYSVDLVIPCYNEEQGLPRTFATLVETMEGLAGDPEIRMASYRLVCVDDGSRDGTWSVIEHWARADAHVLGVKLSRNYGHQSALLAGLSHVSADVSISLDADLQDDVTVIRQMLLAYQNGSDLALGVRTDRRSDTAFKRGSANIYYWLLSALGTRVIENHADFRLMSRRALAALLAHEEVNLFLRGLIPTIGFPVTLVPYTRLARVVGTTNYPVSRMVALALDGITSFSTRPIRLISILGALIFGCSLAVGLVVLVQRLILPQSVVPGWASTLLPLLALGGFQILSLGVIGEYVGKIYMEVKHRPRFIVQETVGAPGTPARKEERDQGV